MKKLITLLCMGVIFVLPFSVKAEDVPGGKVHWECPPSCKVAGNKCQTVCSLSISADVDIEIDTIAGTIIKGDDIVQTKVEPAKGWEYVPLDGNDITFTANPPMKGKSMNVAKITFEYPRDIEDCSINFRAEMYGDAKTDLPKDDPAPTGASLPIVLLVSAVGVAGVLYFVSKKNTKMHRI